MIEVKVRRHMLTVSGHAGYAPDGQDIVCAGVTALTQTLISSIRALTDEEVEVDVMKGLFILVYKDLSETSKTLIDSFFIGICKIADEFPDHVRIV